MKNIMLVHPSFYVYGGAERQIVELCNYLTEKNYKITIFTMNAIDEFKKNLKETRILEVGTDFRELQKAVQKYYWKFDLINSHNHPCELLLHPIKHPHIWQLNEPPDSILHKGILDADEKTIVNKNISKICVISDYEKERTKKFYGMDAIVNYPGIRYDYIAKGINEDYVKRKYTKDTDFTILHPGWVGSTKNQLLTVETLVLLKKEIPEAKVVFAGIDKGPYKDMVIQKATELGVQNDIVFTGYLESDDELRDLYYNSDVSIFPSLEQGSWAGVFESIVAKCPTIVSENFVGSNLVKKHKMGQVIPLDSNCFANAINDIYNHRDVDTDIDTAGKWIKNNLTWKAYGERYERIFEEYL
jgi:glycosyltransferase involved in cell wall biosynthesis